MSRSRPPQNRQPGKVVMPRDAVWLSDRGLWVGDTLLVDHRELRECQTHLEAMLAVAFRRQLPSHVQRSVAAAIDDSRRGDQGLANLRLAIAKHARIADPENWPSRMEEAKRQLASGLKPTEVLGAFGLHDRLDDDCSKFDPAQRRIPAGSGRESGQWTGDGGSGSSSSAIASAAIAFSPRAASLLAPSLDAGALAALSEFAATVGFAATLGALFVPSPNSTSSSGPLPGDTENTYSYDRDEGLLRVVGPSGVVLAAGHKDGSGVFSDANTGVPFAREVDGALFFDSGSVQTVTAVPATAAAIEEEEEDEEKPRLCPDPSLDQPGSNSASARARAYQEQISRMINPERPLPFGLAMSLINPITSKIVHYDECDEQTGMMIEAKGPGFNGLLSFPAGYESVTNSWLDQGSRELEAAGTREVVWYFAEDRAASTARYFFAKNGLGKIIVKYQPPV